MKSTVATLSGLKRLSVKLHKDGIPFSILLKQMRDIRRDNLFPPDLLDECVGFTHLIAIYMSGHAYKRERLLYYHIDKTFRKIKIDDSACKLFCKIRLIANTDKFDKESEQALNLMIGLINRLQSKKKYESKSINERIFFNLNFKFGNYKDGELVHIILLKPVTKNIVTSFKDWFPHAVKRSSV